MTQVAPEEVRTLREFAALSGVFDPGQALRAAAGTAEPTHVVALAAELAACCDTRQGGERTGWLMRGPERRWELGAVADRRGIRAAVQWRRGVGPADDETQDLLDALLGTGSFTPEGIDAALVDSECTALERIAVALDRAGPHSPARDRLDDVRSELTRRECRDDALLAAGFVGRTAELAGIAEWLTAPAVTPPVRALFVGGTPGIGKSTLLEEAVRVARAGPARWLVVRLDFDRRGLDVQDLTGLTVELARQLDAELGSGAHGLREARLTASGSPQDGSPALKGETRERLPVDLVRLAAEQLRTAGGQLLVVLDTLEVLRARGETHPGRLFEWLDQLVGLGLAPVAVLAAGRGDALDSAADRVGRRIDLAGLDDVTADQLLAALDVPESARPAVRATARGNPLVLRLAADVARSAGTRALTRARQQDDGVAAAFLYRVLLSRIPDDALRRLASPGLVVRRLDPDVIREVLAPHLGLGPIDRPRAQQLFDDLTQHHWLVEPDPVATGFVRHRPDTRRVLVRLLYETQPKQAAVIDRAAASWFAARPEPWAEEEVAYHRLQLMRRDPALPYVEPRVLQQLDPDTIAELPETAQDVVRRARGERSSLARGAAPSPGAVPPPGAAAELALLLERGDWLEAAHVYEQTLEGRLFAARSPEADAVLAFLWRSGQWAQAQRLLAERDRLGGDADLAGMRPELAAPRLEMRAELSFAAFVRAPSALVQQVRSGLGDGALGFALRTAQLPPPPTSGPSAVGAAFALWGGAPDDAEPALTAAAEQLGTRVASTDRTTTVGRARLLAVLSPYADAAATLGRLASGTAIAAHAAAADRALGALGGLLPGEPPVSAQPVDPVDGLAALGLLAEWAGAAAFLLHDADLRVLARSAERWRRTTAGQWSYERPPRGWDRPLDVTLTDRLAALAAAADPVAAAWAQLAAWSGDRPVADELRRRLGGALTAAGDVVPVGTDAVAEVLLHRRVPAAFVPPAAVLLAHREL
ncbi:ATP-binding protein [Petropleomorpha daqingensis]|uniref:AAA ATPase domain-containing protein n=1 Tax=Petropleomorpha daqingensis TaxID=2026353 RepID=A0A853CKD2_9ACTN|nr:ATP-binding protein [Petropleomorpha daqingensis]NYJ06433.1 hypothetical protein [Petropleomorpha daqingensis]